MGQALPKIAIHDWLALVDQEPFNLIGHTALIEQCIRVLRRQLRPHLIITGQHGSGKTAVIKGLVQAVAKGQFTNLLPVPYLGLSSSQLTEFLQDDSKQADYTRHVITALQSLPACVLILDNLDTVVATEAGLQFLGQLYKALGERSDIHTILSVRTDLVRQLQTELPHFSDQCEVLEVRELSLKNNLKIFQQQAQRLATPYNLQVTKEAMEAILTAASKQTSEIGLPQRALQLFDDICAACVLETQNVVTVRQVQYVLAQKTGAPTPTRDQSQKLKELPDHLLQAVRGQDVAVRTVAQTIQRAWLGLKNPNRPLGSFLFLGPSGVGKTELAKVLAREVYGTNQAFVRLDMSEFSEPHMVQRLTGAPPGYVGYEAGGQLTNPVASRPFSLILLDEIEKAHPLVFDIFLQVLDDGRLTDGQGRTVDFTKTIIIATSNIGLLDIIAAWQQGQQVDHAEYVRQSLLPRLLQHFRAEFINRFENMLVFNPLSPDRLVEIAQLELAKITKRVDQPGVQFTLSEVALRQKISQIYDPRLGARPLMRWLEQVCEAAVADQLLNRT